LALVGSVSAYQEFVEVDYYNYNNCTLMSSVAYYKVGQCLIQQNNGGGLLSQQVVRIGSMLNITTYVDTACTTPYSSGVESLNLGQCGYGSIYVGPVVLTFVTVHVYNNSACTYPIVSPSYISLGNCHVTSNNGGPIQGEYFTLTSTGLRQQLYNAIDCSGPMAADLNVTASQCSQVGPGIYVFLDPGTQMGSVPATAPIMPSATGGNGGNTGVTGSNGNTGATGATGGGNTGATGSFAFRSVAISALQAVLPIAVAFALAL